MLAHYLAIALAKLRKAPFTTAANVLTLALGLACFITAYGIAAWWRAGDSHHRNAEQIVVIGQTTIAPGQDRFNGLNERSSPTLALHLKQHFPQIAHVARIQTLPGFSVAAADRKTLLDALFVDPEILSIFDFDFIEGAASDALARPGGVILTQDAAARLFGGEAALGRSVRIDAQRDATVTGVIAPVRQPSFMGSGPDAKARFDMIARWSDSPSPFADDARARWFAPVVYTVVVLSPSLSIDAFNARLPDFVAANVPAEQLEFAQLELSAFPISRLSTQSLDTMLRRQAGVPLSAVGALMGLGLLTLAIACVNYANLATALAVGRSKEMGLRKVIGAGRLQVMTQSWLEALLFAAAGFAVALGVLVAAAPMVRTLTGIDVLGFLADGVAPLVLTGVVVLVALSAGAYPAFAVAGVRPAEALQTGRSKSGPRFVMRMLVGVQFFSASFLLLLVIVTQLQREHLERTALAPREDPILILGDLNRVDVDYETLRARLRELPGVLSVSVVDQPLLGVGGLNVVQLARSSAPGAAAPAGFFKSVGFDYFATVNLDVLAGRVFDQARNDPPLDLAEPDPSVTPGIVIDRAYAERLGFSEPEEAVDQIIYLPSEFTQAFGGVAQPVRILGVTETEPTTLQNAGTIAGTTYAYGPELSSGGKFPLIRIERRDVGRTVARITRVWDELQPDAPVNVRFFDELFEQAFRTYSRMSQLFMLLAGSAFAIASIGLLGMAVHIAGRRRHEIGVRKVLGSTTLGVIRLLLIDFGKPVLVANLLAWPVSYLAAQAYLAAFADRVVLTPAPFALSLAITLAIAWAAVIGEVWKAASVRPAEVLRQA